MSKAGRHVRGRQVGTAEARTYRRGTKALVAAIAAGILSAGCARDQLAAARLSSPKSDGAHLSARLGPYPAQDGIFALLGARMPKDDPDYPAWKVKYDRLSTEEKIRYCIHQLRNERSPKMSGFFGGISMSPDQYTGEPERTPTGELIKIGKAAIPFLIDALDSRVGTGIFPSRHSSKPWLVQDAALHVIERVSCRTFNSEGAWFSKLPEEKKDKVESDALRWWRQSKDADETTWAKATLFSDADTSAWLRTIAIWSLVRRLGRESFPVLEKAYHQVPNWRKTDADSFFESHKTDARRMIAAAIRAAPSDEERKFLRDALGDGDLAVRLEAAEGLWKLGDRAGLARMIRDAEKTMNSFGDSWLDSEYSNLVSFLLRCNTRESREAVYGCLSCRNPYLRA